MIEIFDRNRRRVAIAENAHAVSETQKINSVGYFYFSLPLGDPKNEYCKPFYYVRHDGGELYRIMPESTTAEETGRISYQCEHVLATLIDNVLFGYHVVGNLGVYTADVIRYTRTTSAADQMPRATSPPPPRTSITLRSLKSTALGRMRIAPNRTIKPSSRTTKRATARSSISTTPREPRPMSGVARPVTTPRRLSAVSTPRATRTLRTPTVPWASPRF